MNPLINKNRLKTIIIDDDPTGCQTVHGVNVLLKWTGEILKQALNEHDVIFLITNSRSLPESKAIKVNKEITALIKTISSEFKIRIISRGDSTLRGHFFAETKAIIDELGNVDGVVFCPFFYEGGRVTKNNIHYVVTNGQEIPAHDTEFSNDPDFPFETSYLPDYAEKKSGGYWKSNDVVSIGLETIRNKGVDGILKQLAEVVTEQMIIVNAENYDDLEIFAVAAKKAELQGKKFLYRTAASFVKAITGIQAAPFYRPSKKLKTGLVIAGSFVGKTTEQLEYLVAKMKTQPIVIHIERIAASFENYKDEIVGQIEDQLSTGAIPVVYTQRSFLRDVGSGQGINSSEAISEFLCGVVSQINSPLDFIVAKGGITSYDIAKKALKMDSAIVLGQVIKGVPVWKANKLLYVVFPGNVGDNQSLHQVISNLTSG
jgi:uncharacterized protein YgbK (DUF1537 family)